MGDTQLFHITWATHNSRIGERMKEYNIQPGLAVILSENDEIEITKYISNVAAKDNIKILAYNICKDHLHMILLCEVSQRDSIVQKLKSTSSNRFHKAHPRLLVQGVMTPCSKDGRKFHLWQQKYNWTCILNDEQLGALYDYVTNNRRKHNLPESKTLKAAIEKMLTPYDKLFEQYQYF